METIPSRPVMQRQTLADAWTEIESETYAQLDALLDEVAAAQPRIFEDSERALLQENLRLNEKAFFTTVLATTQRAAEAYENKVTILFDVDETIGRAIYGPNFSFLRTALRPSLYTLLKIFEQRKWDVGLLTTRGNPAAQLDDDVQLKSIKESLSKNLLFSVREIGSGDSSSFAKSIKEAYGGANGVIDDSKVSAEVHQIPSTTADQQKIKAIAQMRTKLPNGATVIVDDMPFVKMLNEDAGFYGVYLDREKKGGGCFVLPA